MANFNNLSLTSSGVKALLEAQAGKTLTLSKIGLGSGSTTSGIVSLKALVTPELMIPISETIIDSTEGYMTVVAKMTNENMTEGFYWKETGLFFKDDNDEDILFAYACITDDKYDYIPAFSDQRYVKNIRIANIVTDTDNITVEESEGLMYVDTVTFNAFKDEVVKYNDVVDNLLSESDNLPLSAKQGKVLKESVNQLNSDLSNYKNPNGEYRYEHQGDGNFVIYDKNNNVHFASNLVKDNINAINNDVNSLKSSKADLAHSHDDRYYTESEVNTLLNGKTNLPVFSSTTTGYNSDWISETSVQCVTITGMSIIHISASIVKPISGIGSDSIAIASGLTNVAGNWETIATTQKGHIVKLYGGTEGMVILSYITSINNQSSGSDHVVGVVACAI